MSALPEPRPWHKRLRHYRYDWFWRMRLSPPTGAQLSGVRADPQFDDFAVAAIAISPKYHDWCLSMIDSLRRAGRYAGPVYVVTDAPDAFAGVDNVVPIAVPYSKTQLIAKSCKPLLFRWLNQRYIAYIDADVIVTGGIKPWYERARRALDAGATLLTYPASNPVPGSYHGGILFAERAAALPFLERWLAMLRSGRYLSDQVALKRVSTPDSPAYFADQGFVYLYKLVESGHDAPQEPTFVHITDRMIKDYAPHKLRDYLRDSLGVVRMPEHFGRG